MTAAEALRIAKAAAEADELYHSVHAQERGVQRWATGADIRNAVLTADVAVPEDGAKWCLVGGCDLDDCGLRIVVAIDTDETVIVTVVTVFPT